MLALVNWGTFDSATGGTFQSDTDGTFHSDIPGTFKVLQSQMGADHLVCIRCFDLFNSYFKTINHN